MTDTYIQDNRTLFVETPLERNKLLLRSFTGHEEISQLFNYKLDLLSEDLNINFDKIVGQNVTFSILLGDGQTERYFNGFVSRFSQLPAAGNFAHYEAEVVPWLWFLTRTTDCQIFQNKSVPDIIQHVFESFGFKDFRIELQGSYQPWEYCVQYRETACNFVMRLMEQEGIYFFFKHENGKHTLVMANSPSAHKPCPVQSTVRYEYTTGSGITPNEDMIESWDHSQELRPGRYTLNDYNFTTPSSSLLSGSQGRVDQGGNKTWEIYDYPGEYEKRDEGDSYVKVRMDEEETPHDVVTGTSNCRTLIAGFRFDLTEHRRSDQNGTYVLTSVHHTAHEGGTYLGSDDASALYSNVFVAIPFAVPFRPPRTTPKPLMQGTQTAIVVGKAGEEIDVDNYGRVKVQFHWDRRGKNDENSSCWIRVSQPWAGNKWGAMFIPRIGQEVIVDFLEGDPDRPIIIGRVYNAEEMPPYKLPDEMNKSTIKTNSTKGGGGYNELRFDDTKGKEQIFIHAERNKDIRIKHNRLESVGGEAHLTIEKDQLELVKYDKHLHVKGDHNEKVDGTISLQAGQDMQEKVGTKYALDAGMDIHLKAGMNVVIEAGVTLTLKVGGNFININPGGVFITGMMVMINSGGAAGTGAGASPEAPKDPTPADDDKPGEKSTLPPPKTVTVKKYSPAAVVLQRAAQTGMGFCDI